MQNKKTMLEELITFPPINSDSFRISVYAKVPCKPIAVGIKQTKNIF